jgi:hypothetical protein
MKKMENRFTILNILLPLFLKDYPFYIAHCSLLENSTVFEYPFYSIKTIRKLYKMLFTMKNFLITGLVLCACSLFAQTTSVTTTQETKQVVEREKDGKKWKLTLKNYEVEQLSLNGKIVPTKDYTKYQNVIDALRATANGYEMPFEVVEPVVTSKGIASTTTYEYSESYILTPEQKYVNWKIEEELKNDKFLGDNGKSFQFDLTESALIINGKQQAKELLDKYVDIYYNYSGEQRCKGCTFRLSFNRQAEKSAGW